VLRVRVSIELPFVEGLNRSPVLHLDAEVPLF
jgi:hypothetical protein